MHVERHRHSTRFLILVLTFVGGIAFGLFAAPAWRSSLIYLSSSSYQDVTYKCDRAMRNHLIAKQRLANSPSLSLTKELNMAEVALLDCQTYDLKRKQLIRWGLTENDLSTMALQAIEAKDQDLSKVIEIHEIRY